jgi:hypothetical protein
MLLREYKKVLRQTFADSGLKIPKPGHATEKVIEKILTHLHVKHELGHEFEEEIFPHQTFAKLDSTYWDASRAVSDVFADTIRDGKKKGTLAHIIDNKEKDMLGFFCPQVDSTNTRSCH